MLLKQRPFFRCVAKYFLSSQISRILSSNSQIVRVYNSLTGCFYKWISDDLLMLQLACIKRAFILYLHLCLSIDIFFQNTKVYIVIKRFSFLYIAQAINFTIPIINQFVKIMDSFQQYQNYVDFNTELIIYFVLIKFSYNNKQHY